MPDGSWPLIGREAELARIRSALAGASAGAVVVGQPGVGKTRLAREALAEAAARGHATVWMAAAGGSANVPFAAVASLVEHADLTAPPVQVLHQVRDRLRSQATGGRTVVGVDDAHLLDPASATLVHYVAAAGAARVVVTVRADEPVPDQVTALWKERAAARIDLAPLPLAGVLALVEAILGGPVDSEAGHDLHRISGGNPLYLRELIEEAVRVGALRETGNLWRRRGSLANLSRGLTDLLGARLRRRSPRVRLAIDLVALAEPLEIDLLTACGADPGAVEEAEEAGLLVCVAGPRPAVRAAHPLIAEMVRATMPELRRERLYRSLARSLAATGVAEPVRLAAWQLAGRVASEPATLLAAARQAMAALDRDLALGLARAALAAGAGQPAGLLVAELLAWQGRPAEADAQFADLAAASIVDSELVAATRGRALNLALGLGRIADARALVASALPLLRDPVSRVEVGGIEVVLALHANAPRRAARALASLPRVEVPARLTLASVPSAVIMLLLQGFADQACAFAEFWLGSLRAGGDAESVLLAEMTERALANAHLTAGRLDAASTLADACHQRAMELHAPDQRAVWTLLHGAVAFARGRLARAGRWLVEATALLDEQPPLGGPAGRLLGYGLLAQCAAQRGALPEATAALRAGATIAVPEVLVPEYALGRAWECAARSASGEARRRAAAAGEACAAEDNVAGQLLAWRDLARLGDAANAARRLEQLPAEGPAAAAFTAFARAAARADAIELDAVAARYDGLGMDLLAAEASSLAASIHRRAGRPVRAVASTERARRSAARCEGARTPLLALAGEFSALSGREHEVAALAAVGLSNRAIAERLDLSTRTVENHLHRVFGKLGIARRGELADLLPRGYAGGAASVHRG